MKRPESPLRRALLVLGIHRSGTSVAARIVNLLGAELGDELVPPGPDNPCGFWEHVEAVRINDDLLHGLGRTWYDMRDMPDGWTDSPPARSAVQRIGGLIERDFAASGLCAIKDPRMCLTAPLWIEAFESRGFEVDCLIVVRDPREVVESLHRRNDWPRAPLYLMWVQYLMQATAASGRLRRSMVTYDQLLSDWRSSMTRVARELQLSWPAMPDTAVAQAVDAFVDPGHRHHVGPASETEGEDAAMPRLALDLHRACLGIASDAEEWTAISGFHDSFRKTARLYAAHVNHLLAERWGAEGRAQTAEARLAEQVSVTTVVRDAAQALQEKLDARLGQMQHEMSALSGEIAARFERQRECMLAVEARIQRQHALLNTLSLRMEQAASDRVTEKSGDVDAASRFEVQALQSALTGSNATIAALFASTSWKLTAPMRWFSVHVLQRPPALVGPAVAAPGEPDSRGAPPDTTSVEPSDAAESAGTVARESANRRDGNTGPVALRWMRGASQRPVGDGRVSMP